MENSKALKAVNQKFGNFYKSGEIALKLSDSQILLLTWLIGRKHLLIQNISLKLNTKCQNYFKDYNC